MLARNNSPSLAAAPAQNVSSGQDAPVLDRAAMLATVENDFELLHELVELFFAESPGLLAQIRAGIAERNPEAVERGAHTLKGALETFGARRSGHAARELELRGRESRLDDAAGLLSALESEIALASSALSDFLREIRHEGSSR